MPHLIGFTRDSVQRDINITYIIIYIYMRSFDTD